MIKFFGEYNVKVDDKGRLIFPAAFKGIMPAEGDMRFVVRKDNFAECLEMYTFSEWERTADGRLVVRLATSWATRTEDIDELINNL